MSPRRLAVTALAIVLTSCCTRTWGEEKVLFDFEDEAEVKGWQQTQLPKAKTPEPEVQLALATQHFTSGQHALKLTYAGGTFPTIASKRVPEDLTPYGTLKADVTVGRPMVIGFRIMQDNSKPEKHATYWESTMLLKAGRNEVSLSLKKPHRYRTGPYSAKQGNAVSLSFYVYSPTKGEEVYVDNIRLTTEDDPNADNKRTPNTRPKAGYKVLGTNLTVRDVGELGAKLKDKWVRPERPKTVAEREAEFNALYDKLKETHPRAVMVLLREGQKGYDRANPDKAYVGWNSTYVDSHGPDGNLHGRAHGQYDWGNLELFMRHRSQMMRIDLSCVPKGAKILAVRLLLVASYGELATKPNMFVAEACNRPWADGEVNCYRYAKGKLWRSCSGQYYDGDDPDFLPLFLAYGPADGKTSVWDFTEAVKWWLEGGHPNHGFFLHGDAQFYARTFTRRCKEVQKRPALMIIYEP